MHLAPPGGGRRQGAHPSMPEAGGCTPEGLYVRLGPALIPAAEFHGSYYRLHSTIILVLQRLKFRPKPRNWLCSGLIRSHRSGGCGAAVAASLVARQQRHLWLIGEPGVFSQCERLTA